MAVDREFDRGRRGGEGETDGASMVKNMYGLHARMTPRRRGRGRSLKHRILALWLCFVRVFKEGGVILGADPTHLFDTKCGHLT